MDHNEIIEFFVKVLMKGKTFPSGGIVHEKLGIEDAIRLNKGMDKKISLVPEKGIMNYKSEKIINP